MIQRKRKGNQTDLKKLLLIHAQNLMLIGKFLHISNKPVYSKGSLTFTLFRLCGPRGIRAIHATFQDVQLRGKGYEKSDLDIILKKTEHWAHRLFPKMPFQECIEKVEKLGTKKAVQVIQTIHHLLIFSHS